MAGNCRIARDENIVGYLFFCFDGDLDRKFQSTTFVFESLDRKVQRLEVRESDIKEQELFFDDTIWQKVDMEDIQRHPTLSE